MTFRRKAPAMIAASAGLLALTACGSGVPASDIEETLEEDIRDEAEAFGMSEDDIDTLEADCEDDLEAEEGATITCTVEFSGTDPELGEEFEESEDFVVEAVNVDGDEVEYEYMPAAMADTDTDGED